MSKEKKTTDGIKTLADTISNWKVIITAIVAIIIFAGSGALAFNKYVVKKEYVDSKVGSIEQKVTEFEFAFEEYKIKQQIRELRTELREVESAIRGYQNNGQVVPDYLIRDKARIESDLNDALDDLNSLKS